jgi:hypothetical protein
MRAWSLRGAWRFIVRSRSGKSSIIYIPGALSEWVTIATGLSCLGAEYMVLPSKAVLQTYTLTNDDRVSKETYHFLTVQVVLLIPVGVITEPSL